MVKRTLEIDEEAGMDFLAKSPEEEMGNIEPCIEIIVESGKPLPGHSCS